VIGLTGCGGSNGGGSLPAATTRAITTNVLRIFTTGDFIKYNVTGTSTSAGVVSTISGTATLAYTATSPADPLGNTHSTETYTPSLMKNGVPFVAAPSVRYYDQTASGTFRKWSDLSSAWIVSPVSGNVVRFRSPMVVGDTWQHTYIDQLGERINETTTVNARAIVATAMGAFETFKITIIQDRQARPAPAAPFQSFQSIVDVDYIVPSIGIIKFTSTTNSIASVPITSSSGTWSMITTNIAF